MVMSGDTLRKHQEANKGMERLLTPEEQDALRWMAGISSKTQENIRPYLLDQDAKTTNIVRQETAQEIFVELEKFAYHITRNNITIIHMVEKDWQTLKAKWGVK